MRSSMMILLAAAVACTGCNTGAKSPWGFTLPDGDAERGEEIFVRMNCHACHTVAGIEQLKPLDGEPEITVALGGEVARIKTYGELVTSVINPSHRFSKGFKPDELKTEEGESKMPIYNDVMTVSELIDVVAFLQSKYRLRPFEPTPYYPY